MAPMFHTLLVVFSFWCVLCSVNKLLTNYGPFKNLYVQCKESLGISITFPHLRFYSTRFNNLFKVWGLCSRRLARLWFDLGVLVGLLLMAFAFFIMILTLYQSMVKEELKGEQVLTPLMPGVNLPWNEVSYYFFTIIACGVFHEVGHALAAITEQVRINGFGMFILFIYPGAFVDLHSDHLTVISPRRQLRIYCAGVWHNVILSVTMLFFLQTLPYLLLPFYSQGQGAVITSIDKDSVLYSKLSPGDSLIQINSCPITSSRDWYSCIADITSHTQTGYCVSYSYIESHKLLTLNMTSVQEDGIRECCPKDTQRGLCFSVSPPAGPTVGNSVVNRRYACLTARQVISTDVCHSNKECAFVDPSMACATPTIAAAPLNHLAKIRHTGTGDPVIFLGDLRTLAYNTKVTDFLPLSSLSPLWLPSVLQTVCIYMISISSALGLLNMLPAYALDGQWALSAFLEHLIPEHPQRNRILNSVLMVGTLLLVLNILLGLWILINW